MPDRYTKNYPVTTVHKDGTVHYLERTVVKEGTIELLINGTHAASILASPACVRELAVGYAICEGIVDSNEILDVRVNGMEVDLHIKCTGNLNIWHELRSSGYIGVKCQGNENINVSSDTVFPAKSIFSGTKFLESGVYRVTKGTHLAALVSRNGELVAQAVDIGRHNAIDKVIGHATLNNIDVSQLYLLSTGRQSAGMVLKAARAGVPLVVTKSAPFDSGIKAAEKTGMGLIGFVSSNEMTVFANKWRID
ncbi:MAG TPA: formate dehydrogenase accessory sulfurtransferase FdhD [Methanosarcinaceae archaeon]|nr:formate dehydrogenase accessory sulfurtransferase FdhD [Methanosarcinaceae archaeon]